MQLKISLNGAKPPIWRRIQLAQDATFLDLHAAIQDAMGWADGHLHEFSFEQKTSKKPILIGPPDSESMFKTHAEKKELVRDWLGAKWKQCIYTYDFGDNWDHTVLFEKTLPAEPGVTYPRCVAGKRACPPEDSGGIWGYEHRLKVLADPSHPEYEETREWLGLGEDEEAPDPDQFDPSSVVFYPSKEHDIAAMRRELQSLPIETVDDALDEIDDPPAGIPFEAINFLRAAPTTPKLIDRITFVIEHAYDKAFLASGDFSDVSPIWYTVVAERHLSPNYIEPTIRLVTSTTDDWDFLNEQAQYLICLLAEKYPEQVADATMKSIDAAIHLGLRTPYLFLFDVFRVVDAKKYVPWLLKTMAHPNNFWKAPFADLFLQLQLTEAIPVLEQVVHVLERSEPRAMMVGYSEAREIAGYVQYLKNPASLPKDILSGPEYKDRGDWEAHFRRFADRFEDNEGDDSLMSDNTYASEPYLAAPKIGRNDPCPCGSTKKYKKCCGVV
ncbi:MAG: SEC-C metal-binding domain-containing protein [Candidatus Saccharimonadales bacterium]